MILRIKLSNIAGIKDEMDLNFIATKTDKKNINSVYITEDNIWINRLIGIIAGNAHGKSTILDAIASIGSFIELPLRKKNIPSLNDIEMKEYKEEYKEKVFKQMITDYTNIDLPAGNKLNNNKNSLIEIEMYIKNDDNLTSGYYLYSLEYDKSYKTDGIKKEKLAYKNKYKKKYLNIFEITNSFESEIGYKIAYEKNYISELQANNIDVTEFEKKIKYYKAFVKHYNKDSSIIFADNYVFPEFYIVDMIEKCNALKELTQFVKLADDNIEEIFIDKNSDGKKKLMFKYNQFNLEYNEVSTATQKLVAMAYSILESNKNNSVFLIDEFDNSLNLEISKFLIDIFASKSKSMSQIIFTTNNPDILDNLRRDQIYLLLKRKYNINAINFYNFTDPITKKRVRKDFSFVKAYKKNVIENFPSSELKEIITNSFMNLYIKKED